jgi:YidC/Oxa1 family membrane protein insertase
MTNTRPFLFFALCAIGFFLWQAWEKDYGSSVPPGNSVPAPAATATPAPATPAVPGDIPSAASAPAPATASTPAAAASTGQRIEIRTDVLHAVIDTRGGNLVEADLLAYPVDPSDRSKPVHLLSDTAEGFFVAQTGLVSNGSPAPDHKALFSTEKTTYALADGAETLEVPLTWTDASGLTVRKVYIFKRASYLIDTRQEVTNAASSPWTGNEYRQLQRVPPVIKSSGFAFSDPERFAFAGAAWYSPKDKFQKLAFDKFATSPLKQEIAGGWAAMLQHYFFAAWIPDPAQTDTFTTETVKADSQMRYLVRDVSPALTVAPNETKAFSARLYVGPKLQSTLDQIAPGLALTVDYGVLTFIASPLHWVLVELYALVKNWGLAIILLVLLIKLALFKLSEAQFRSMAKMKRLQPRLEALKERYGDDKQKYNAAMMELYQKEKINPLGGCLPMVVQIPVFFALYWVLLESVELRQAPFFGWIQNLSAPDPYFVLPVLNALATLASQWLSPNPGMDPTQAKIMKTMPLAMAVMFAFFPAGLVLYWTVNGGLSLLQQWVITQRLQSADNKART